MSTALLEHRAGRPLQSDPTAWCSACGQYPAAPHCRGFCLGCVKAGH